MQSNVTFPDGQSIPVNPGPFHSGHMPTSPFASVVVPLWVPVGPTGPHQHIQTAGEIQALLDGDHGIIAFTGPNREPAYWIASPDDARTLFAQMASYPSEWLPWVTTGAELTVNGTPEGAYAARRETAQRLVKVA